MKPRFVLDAWAILALLQGEEPAATRVRQLLEDAEMAKCEMVVSALNLGEVYYRVGKVKGETQAQRTLDDLRRLAMTVIPASEEAVFSASSFKIHYSISYADAFAASAALSVGGTLVTGDPELLQLGSRWKMEELERSRR